MRNLQKTVALVSLTVVLGCGSPATTGMWVASDDGMLALRLSLASDRVKEDEPIHAVAEIENRSQQKLTILRPFGDWYAAEAVGVKIWDAQGQVRYTGPNVTYVIGGNAFAVIGPGEVIQDKLELKTENHEGAAAPGRYTLRYDYSYDGHWDATAAAGSSGISGAWRGTISSREVQVVRE